MILAQSCAADQAHLRSHAGPGASDVFHGAPNSKRVCGGTPISSAVSCWRGSVCHWMSQMPFASAGADWTQKGDIGQRVQDQEGCAHGPSDQRGTLARICREAGALVRCNTKLRDMNVAVPAADERAIEVLASGLPPVPGSAVGCGRHGPKCTDSQRIGLRWGSHHRRSCPRTSTRRQGAQVPRALGRAIAVVWWSWASKQEADGVVRLPIS